MIKQFKISFLTALLLSFSQCSSLPYWQDRGNDLGDIVSIQVGGGLGLGAQLSRVSTGIGMFITNKTENKIYYQLSDISLKTALKNGVPAPILQRIKFLQEKRYLSVAHLASDLEILLGSDNFKEFGSKIIAAKQEAYGDSFFMLLAGFHKSNYFNYEYSWSTFLFGMNGSCKVRNAIDRQFIERYSHFLQHCEQFRGTTDNSREELYIRNKSYTERTAGRVKYLDGKVEFILGLVLALDIQFNFYELGDFFLGFAGVDILYDDRYVRSDLSFFGRKDLVFFIVRGNKNYIGKKYLQSYQDYQHIINADNRKDGIEVLHEKLLRFPDSAFYLNTLAELYLKENNLRMARRFNGKARRFSKDSVFDKEVDQRSLRIQQASKQETVKKEKQPN